MFGTKKHVDQHVFAMFDSKAGTYGNPMFAINQLTLIREIEALMNDPSQEKNQIVTNPEDFSLFQIGTYDRQTGKFESQSPTHVISMHEIKATLQYKQLQAQSAQKSFETLNQ